MPDPADIGNEIAQFYIAEAEYRARGKSGPESHPEFDGLNCVDCTEPIAEARLALGKVRCVDCQGVLELQEKMREY